MTLLRCNHSRPEWTWERCQWRSTSHSPKLRHHRKLTIILFSVISRTVIVGGSTTLQRCSRCILQPKLNVKERILRNYKQVVQERESRIFSAERISNSLSEFRYDTNNCATFLAHFRRYETIFSKRCLLWPAKETFDCLSKNWVLKKIRNIQIWYYQEN